MNSKKLYILGDIFSAFQWRREIGLAACVIREGGGGGAALECTSRVSQFRGTPPDPSRQVQEVEENYPSIKVIT